MALDKQNEFSNAQAVTTTAASTNIIDLGANNNLGIGIAMAVVIHIQVAADMTTGDETYRFDIETDSASAFSSPTLILSKAVVGGSLGVGARVVVPVPPDKSMEQFIGLRYTTGGTSPSITIKSAYLIPQSALQNDAYYPSGYTVV